MKEKKALVIFGIIIMIILCLIIMILSFKLHDYSKKINDLENINSGKYVCTKVIEKKDNYTLISKQILYYDNIGKITDINLYTITKYSSKKAYNSVKSSNNIGEVTFNDEDYSIVHDNSENNKNDDINWIYYHIKNLQDSKYTCTNGN